MKTTVEIGYGYALRSEMGGEVTNAETGKPLETLEPNKQVHMTAQEPEWVVPDDCQVTKMRNFNHALVALGLLGGGADKLPAGYTRVEFLESTGTQYINSGLRLTEGFVLKCDFVPTQVLGHGCLFGARLASKSVHCMRDNTAGTYGVPIISNEAFAQITIPVSLNESYSLELNDIDKKLAVNGKETSGADFYSVPELEFYIFCENFPQGGNLANGVRAVFFDAIRIKSFKLTNGGRRHNLVPALDPSGTPCMFDTVSKQPFRNVGSGQFVAGIGSVAQLTNLLRNLPATGGELTLSLPAEANTPEVAEQLQACHDTKGWTITVHEYRPAAAATYSLRRVREVVWCRCVQAEYGSYANVHGVRYNIEHCAAIFGPLGQDPTDYGYEPFDSVEEAAEQWGLVPYIEPEIEEMAD